MEARALRLLTNNSYFWKKKMKSRRKLLLGLGLVLMSCGGGSSEVENTIDMNGPDVEVKVLSYSIETSETELEVINRLDESITNMNGVLTFENATAEIISYTNGNPKSSPFSQAQNPHIVKAKSKRIVKLRNSLPDETHVVHVSEVTVKTSSGKEVMAAN
jgi:hypothetical protein